MIFFFILQYKTVIIYIDMMIQGGIVMDKSKGRNSNFELLRIVSMLMIVTWHVIVHSKAYDLTSGSTHILIQMFSALLMIHVNSFVLLSGYFQRDKPMI